VTEPIKLLSHDALDELVDTDPIRLRDEAFKMRAEIERLNAYFNTIDRLNEVADADWKQEVDRLKGRVAVLTALLNDPARLVEHLRELRAVLSESEANDETDRLAAGGEV
jgi:hypothetical protein